MFSFLKRKSFRDRKQVSPDLKLPPAVKKPAGQDQAIKALNALGGLRFAVRKNQIQRMHKEVDSLRSILLSLPQEQVEALHLVIHHWKPINYWEPEGRFLCDSMMGVRTHGASILEGYDSFDSYRPPSSIGFQHNPSRLKKFSLADILEAFSTLAEVPFDEFSYLRREYFNQVRALVTGTSSADAVNAATSDIITKLLEDPSRCRDYLACSRIWSENPHLGLSEWTRPSGSLIFSGERPAVPDPIGFDGLLWQAYYSKINLSPKTENFSLYRKEDLPAGIFLSGSTTAFECEDSGEDLDVISSTMDMLFSRFFDEEANRLGKFRYTEGVFEECVQATLQRCHQSAQAIVS